MKVLPYQFGLTTINGSRDHAQMTLRPKSTRKYLFIRCILHITFLYLLIVEKLLKQTSRTQNRNGICINLLFFVFSAMINGSRRKKITRLFTISRCFNHALQFYNHYSIISLFLMWKNAEIFKVSVT